MVGGTKIGQKRNWPKGRRSLTRLRQIHTVSDPGIKDNPLRQRIEVNAMSLTNMSHGQALAFHDHLDHRIVVCRSTQTCLMAGILCVWRKNNVVYLSFALSM